MIQTNTHAGCSSQRERHKKREKKKIEGKELGVLFLSMILYGWCDFGGGCLRNGWSGLAGGGVAVENGRQGGEVGGVAEKGGGERR